jgi:hypothetical protein
VIREESNSSGAKRVGTNVAGIKLGSNYESKEPRTMKRLLFAALFMGLLVGGQTTKQTTAHRPTLPDCSAAVESAKNEAGEASFTGAWTFATSLMATKISDSEKPPFKIKLVVEDIEGSDSYQLAAAELVKQYFSDILIIDPTGDLTLYVGGTKRDLAGRVQHFDIRIEASVVHTFTVGNKSVRMPGYFVFTDDGMVLTNYNQTEKTQAVREKLYKLLSDFRSRWIEAAN